LTGDTATWLSCMFKHNYTGNKAVLKRNNRNMRARSHYLLSYRDEPLSSLVTGPLQTAGPVSSVWADAGRISFNFRPTVKTGHAKLRWGILR